MCLKALRNVDKWEIEASTDSLVQGWGIEGEIGIERNGVE